VKASASSLRGKDLVVMAAMVAVYLAVALCNLGNLNVPATAWQPLQKGETLLIDLGRPVSLERIYYYCGIDRQRSQKASFSLACDRNGRFQPLTVLEKDGCALWKYEEIEVTTARLRLTAESTGGSLNELVLMEKGACIPLTGVAISGVRDESSSPANLLDEQQTFAQVPSFRNGFYFDEVYHGRTAYEHLHRMEPYESTHPPLGKLFIASGIALFGMNSFGWRITGTLFGAALLPVMYLFGRKLFNSTFFAFAAAFLMMVDFMHFTQSRIALIDIFAVFFITLMYHFIYDFYVNDSPAGGLRQMARPLLLAGICFGLGAACKWIAIYAGAGAALLVGLRLCRSWRQHRAQAERKEHFRNYLLPVALVCSVSFLLVPAVIYLLSYIPYLLVDGGNHGIMDILRNQRHMFTYHSGLKDTHPFASRWWSWPLDLRPVWFYSGKDLAYGRTSTIASFGNPLIWWTGIPAVVAAAVIALRQRERGMVVVLTGFVFQYLPWLFVSRVTFIYHFFSVVPFMILAQVHVMTHAVARWPRARYGVAGYLAVAGLLFVVFYPVLSGMEVSSTYVEGLRWLKTWVF
jgi:dolichyl-phosphate-mannose--protein O-mannosyl transferase